ncbi:isoleucyl-tRNA synthetase [Cutibacterium acnes JCM 18920]|nr:isoleucyl-tRNA synthetase [Cutibacterium acnes JCM 18920]
MTDVNPVRSDNCRQYNNVPPQIDLPAMDHEIIDLWARQHTFDKSLEATKDGRPWTFFEGPPTANGQPGTHHVEARVFKDIFPRFKTMQGSASTARQAGTVTVYPSNWPLKRSSGSPVSLTSRSTALNRSMPNAASPLPATSMPSANSPSEWATGSIWMRRIGR